MPATPKALHKSGSQQDDTTKLLQQLLEGQKQILEALKKIQATLG